MDFLRDHSIQNELLLIFISVFLGLCIGTEREYRNKSAGLRTFILVCFGSCLFTILSIKIGVSNPDRLAANIITGIGFLGAGVIFKGDNKIDGITTATTIWATASIGMAVGSGYVYLSLLGTILVLLILSSLTYFQTYIDHLHKIREYKIAVSNKENLDYCEELFKMNHLKFVVVKQQFSKGSSNTTWIITGKNNHHENLIQQMMNDEKIDSFQF
ncbi:MgtC/SapB family protein [Chryseobacterium sp. Ch-15]|uniref:MgtC/SapB family protein n=1 Tax=Chryseobacterium muglaense TaxID=2893752 RepID=A0A9Q3UUK4_9FLAO|nr:MULTISPECIES: MgtC/SapB family protein [Chryseobacterium]MBD3905233.1 MgtC/SapB family protein [Chryseobacterium muglaense]MBO6186672.1 MgtC/SapB family protein [Chryseobacterium sp.]MCC9034061.1 MgtC/SapB family protein [Chryseobacterium muglaense]MCM2555054.1 MgtC/SapB family protein [Chryseobacterium muglaense]